MGCRKECFDKVINTICNCVEIKEENGLEVTIGLQMVLMPEFSDQIIPFVELGKELGVDYAVIKHCSDNELGSLGVDYSKYFKLVPLLEEAEKHTTKNYLVKAKWSKLLSEGKRCYTQCYGPPFMLQISGSGLVAPCGMFFNPRYEKFHIGSIVKQRFKDIWQSDRYWEVMNYLASDKFNAKTDCGCLCLHHKVNEFLWELKKGTIAEYDIPDDKPLHINFI
jgi:hypothetical protein